jgi:hypothetical protein
MEWQLIRVFAQLDLTAADKDQARQVLLNRLADHETKSEEVEWLADMLAQLDPPAADKDQARQVLLNRHPARRARARRRARAHRRRTHLGL